MEDQESSGGQEEESVEEETEFYPPNQLYVEETQESVQELGGGGADGDGGQGEPGTSGLRPPGFATPAKKRGPPTVKVQAKKRKTSEQSRDSLVINTLDGLAQKEEDPDRSFLLSLLPFFNQMPGKANAMAKVHIMSYLVERAYPVE